MSAPTDKDRERAEALAHNLSGDYVGGWYRAVYAIEKQLAKVRAEGAAEERARMVHVGRQYTRKLRSHHHHEETLLADAMDDLIDEMEKGGGLYDNLETKIYNATGTCAHGVAMSAHCMTCISRGDDPRGLGRGEHLK